MHVDIRVSLCDLFACGLFSLHSDCSVFGGWPYLAYQYIEKAVGAVWEFNGLLT